MNIIFGKLFDVLRWATKELGGSSICSCNKHPREASITRVRVDNEQRTRGKGRSFPLSACVVRSTTMCNMIEVKVVGESSRRRRQTTASRFIMIIPGNKLQFQKWPVFCSHELSEIYQNKFASCLDKVKKSVRSPSYYLSIKCPIGLWDWNTLNDPYIFSTLS